MVVTVPPAAMELLGLEEDDDLSISVDLENDDPTIVLQKLAAEDEPEAPADD